MNIGSYRRPVDAFMWYKGRLEVKYFLNMFNDLATKKRIVFCASITGSLTVGNCPEQARVGDAIVLVSGVQCLSYCENKEARID
jgi:hypothetical protein